MSTPRYVVGSVTGYTIGPHGSGKTPTTTWFVLDRANAHREVAVSHHPTGWSARAAAEVKRRERIEALAARLNAEDEAWARENGYPA